MHKYHEIHRTRQINVFAKRLRNWRLNRGLTQKDLAEEWKVSPQFISHMELGNRPVPAWVRSVIRRDGEVSKHLTGFGQKFEQIVDMGQRRLAQSLPLREEIQKLTEAGMRQKDIAEKLGVTTMTVFRHQRYLREEGKQ